MTDVRARAGVLASAFREGNPVSDAEIESYLRATAGEIDAFVGSHGYPVPVTDDVASAALASANADMALELALEANWPGSAARDDVSDLLTAVQDRVKAYRTAMASGALAALLYLGATVPDTDQQGGGASSFWTQDAFQYDWWVRFVDRTWGPWADPWGVPTTQEPIFHRGMSL